MLKNSVLRTEKKIDYRIDRSTTIKRLFNRNKNRRVKLVNDYNKWEQYS